MKCGGIDNSCAYALLLLLVALQTTGLHSTPLYLDEVLGDVIEKLFGAVVQDEFAELFDDCPDASSSLKRTGDCISHRNLSYHRFDRASPDAVYVNQLCDDLSAVGACFESVIEALQSCSGSVRPIQKQNVNAVGAALDAALDYFCDNSGYKLNEFFNQGFPRCFIRRPGRHLARCFPGRITGQASDRHRDNHYWGTIGDEHDFFNARNCLLLRNHTACAVDTLHQCSTNGVDVFQGAIDTVMEHLMCVVGQPDLQENSQSDDGVASIQSSVSVSTMLALVTVELHGWLFTKSC